jgi:mannose-6-phosphate isomerase-like protein (cupin superfamily)
MGADVLSSRHRYRFAHNNKEGELLMRKTMLGILLLFVATSAKAQAPKAATDITAAQVQAFIKDAPHDRNSDRPMRVVDTGGHRVGIFGVFRPKSAPPNATVHQTNVSEVYYMLEGAGTLVTGGTLKKPATPRQSTLGNWTDVASNGIEGGVSRRIAKGDIVIIPGGVPHGWASTESDITYLIVRPDPDKKLELK